MTLRTRLSLMLSIFFVLIAILVRGVNSYIRENKRAYGESLRSGSEENKLYNELDRNIGDFVDATRGWRLTGDAKYKKQYFKKLSDVRKSFGNLSATTQKTEERDMLGKEFQQIIEYSEGVIGNRQPVGEPEVIGYFSGILILIALDVIKEN